MFKKYLLDEGKNEVIKIQKKIGLHHPHYFTTLEKAFYYLLNWDVNRLDFSWGDVTITSFSLKRRRVWVFFSFFFFSKFAQVPLGSIHILPYSPKHTERQIKMPKGFQRLSFLYLLQRQMFFTVRGQVWDIQFHGGVFNWWSLSSCITNVDFNFVCLSHFWFNPQSPVKLRVWSQHCQVQTRPLETVTMRSETCKLTHTAIWRS